MRRVPAWGVLAALVAVSTIVRALAGLRVPTPWIAADEMIYAELGRSLWESGHLDILGQDAAFYSLVHPALIGLPLALFDTAVGYDIARVLQAFVMSLAAVPVFAWGRRLMSERWALAAAALTLCLPGLAYSGLLMSETVFYPIVALAAWLAARALTEPTPRSQALLVAVVVLAVLTRLQGVVLVPAFVLAVAIYAAAGRTMTPFVRLWPSLAALAVVGVGVVSIGFGAYEPAGSAQYAVGDALRFGVYHAADLLLLVGIVPACAVAALALARPDSPEVRAYLAVTLAFAAGFVAEVGLFASRYVGRLAERDLLGLAPLFFLGLCLWIDRGAPRRRASSYVVAFAAAALVLALPLGRLVHEAALPDAFTLIPVWQLGSYDVVVWTFAAVAVLAFALLPRRFLVAIPVALALLFAVISISVSRYVAKEASLLQTAFFGESDPEWVDATAQGDVAYFYDGEPYWNAVWSYVFWNRKINRVYVLAKAPRVPGPMPQRRVDPFPLGELGGDDSPTWVVGATPTFTFPGEAVATVSQVGLGQNGLTLWRSERPLRLQTAREGVQGSGDIYGPASMIAYGCRGGTFELTLIAKGSPVTVRLDSGQSPQEQTIPAEGIWRPSVPAVERDGVCRLGITPSGIVGSTRFEYVPG
ncbi:MAG: glycosyltransferase family 39 protein [Actinomycetota bacterium]